MTIWREADNVEWDVPSDVKEEIRYGLVTAQRGLCAFCCAKLPHVPQLVRIAHIEPRDINPKRALDFTNMVASCSSGRDKLVGSAMAPRDQACDESQGNRTLPVHPRQPDCQERFTYLGNGAIRPAVEGNGARETIDILNLDCDRLRQGRMGAIRGAMTMRSRMATEDWNRIYRNPVAPYGREFWPAIAFAA